MICFIDYRTSENEINSLRKLNYDIIKIPKDNNLYEAINGHTDIQLNILNKHTKAIIINKNITHDSIEPCLDIGSIFILFSID